MADDPSNKRQKRQDRWADSSSSEDEDESPIVKSNCDDDKPGKDLPASDNTKKPGFGYVVAKDKTDNFPVKKIEVKEKKLRRYNPGIRGCREVSTCYERISRINEGTYGIVWKAKEISTGETVALKQIKFHSDLTRDGFPHPALREIWALLALSHECVVNVREMVVGNRSDRVFMVMDFLECDLSEALERCDGTGNPLPGSELKTVMHNILSGMVHIHENWYMHRDMKTSNILIRRATGQACICDLGLARKYSDPPKKYTHLVITLWYRPPELLLGTEVYGPEVDIWSVGCIFGELFTKTAMMQGQGELDQIDKIFRLLGGPNEENWPDFKMLPNAKTFRWAHKGVPKIREMFPVDGFANGGRSYLDSSGLDLLRKMLTLDPRKRISASDALKHPYFTEGVKMQSPRFIFD